MKKLIRITTIFCVMFYLQMNGFYKHEIYGQEPLKNPKKQYTLFNMNESDIKVAQLGEKIFITSDNIPMDTDHWIFINNFKLDQLKKKNDANLFWFELKKSEELSESINPDNKPELLVSIAIGTNILDKKIIEENFNIIFDKNKIERKWWTGVSLAIVAIISVIMLLIEKGRILRDQGTKLKKPPFSLSRTQMAFWTFVILISYFVIWWQTGESIKITGEVLALLGISAGTKVGASMVDNDDISNPKITKRHQEINDSRWLLPNIMSDSNGLSIHRFQNVVFTLAIASYFLYKVFTQFELPDLDNNLIVLMGISSGTYVAIKRGENKAYQDSPVG